MLYGKRVRLRAIERSDLPRYVTWFNDPEVIAGLAMFAPMSLAQEEQWFAEMVKHPGEEQPLALDVRVRGKWEHIGGTGFNAIDRRNQSAEFGIHIGEKKYWNKGYGTEALQVLLRYGFETLNLHRIWLRVFDFNRRAQRSYEKAGFKKEGMYREAQFHAGKFCDVYLYSLLRREWAEAAGGAEER
jgi:diamine N-acetyltransferase